MDWQSRVWAWHDVASKHSNSTIDAAGIAQSQHFLASVAKDRIATRPWITRIDGQTVHFADGSSCMADALLFGTGYRLSLPWLAPSIASLLGLDDRHIDLHDHTFHPLLPGLAFIGLQDQVGPVMPVLELQARWVAIPSQASYQLLQRGQ